MSSTQTPDLSTPATDGYDDPKKAAELQRLCAKLERLNKEAEQLGAAMRQKPNEWRY